MLYPLPHLVTSALQRRRLSQKSLVVFPLHLAGQNSSTWQPPAKTVAGKAGVWLDILSLQANIRVLFLMEAGEMDIGAAKSDACIPSIAVCSRRELSWKKCWLLLEGFGIWKEGSPGRWMDIVESGSDMEGSRRGMEEGESLAVSPAPVLPREHWTQLGDNHLTVHGQHGGCC